MILFLLIILLLPTVACADVRTDQPGMLVQTVDGNTSGRPRILKVTDSTLTNNGDGSFTLDNSGTATSGWTDDGTVVRLTTSTDNVGIGTIAPPSLLSVRGTGLFYGAGGALRLANSSNINYIQSGQAALTGWQPLYFGAYSSTTDIKMAIDGNGNVGIGTSLPGTKLEVLTSASVDGLKLTRAGGERVAWMTDSGTGVGSINLFNGADSNSIFLTGNGSSFLNGGNVGIGANPALSLLDITSTAAQNLFVVNDNGGG